MLIKVIYDNEKENEAMENGWGFSCFIDLGDRKILFDTGADKNAFFSNLQKLNVSLEEITDVVISHKHSDHTAGFQEILAQLNKDVRLFLPKGFPSSKTLPHFQTTFVETFTEIDRQIYSFVLKGGFRLYEQALAFQTKKGLVVVTGCAHFGVVHLLETIQKQLGGPIHLVLGGFHLFRTNHGSVNKIVNQFKSLNVEKAAPCHCSGAAAISQFQEAYLDRYCKIGTGTILHLE